MDRESPERNGEPELGETVCSLDREDETGENRLGMVLAPSHRTTLRELREKRNELRHQLAAVETAIRGLEALESKTSGSARRTTDVQMLTHSAAVSAVLTKSSRPLSVGEILDALSKTGRPVETTKPYRTVYNTLRKDGSRFERVGKLWRVRATN